MNFPKTRRRIIVNTTLLAIFVILFSSVAAKAQSDELSALRAEAIRLLNQDKYLEALPVLEKLAVADSTNSHTQFYLGFALLAKAQVTKEPEEARQIRVKARAAFLRSKALGSTEKSIDAFIESIPENGNIPSKFSKNSAAENAMNEAESAFVSGKIDEALKLYQTALQLDPTIYEAALFAGDMYVRKDDFANAETWYQKAIQINPNRETAYRYSATPLMRQKKYDLARDRYIEAFITEPYNRFTTVGFGQWADATKSSLAHPKIDIPVSISDDGKGGIKIILDFATIMNAGKDDGSPGWLVYGGVRKEWRTEKFAKTFPNEKTYRHSLPEETEALQTAIVSAVATQKKKSSKLTPALALLKELNDKGLLESFILLGIPDQGIAADHEAYLKENRPKLRQYVLQYVIKK